jgi:SCY1-like protein 2
VLLGHLKFLFLLPCCHILGLLWKIYSGYKKSTRQEASIFVFEKRNLDRYGGKSEREALLASLRKGVGQLTRLRHPRLLVVQHPLEESR